MEIFEAASEDRENVTQSSSQQKRTATFVHIETVRCDLRHVLANEIGQFHRPPRSVKEERGVERRTAGRGYYGRKKGKDGDERGTEGELR